MNMNEVNSIIKWAFEKGYELGHCDGEDGVYLDYDAVSETFMKQHFENVQEFPRSAIKKASALS